MQPPARHGKAPRRWRAGVAEQRERGEALLAGGGQGAGGISPHEEAILRLIVGRESSSSRETVQSAGPVEPARPAPPLLNYARFCLYFSYFLF